MSLFLQLRTIIKMTIPKKRTVMNLKIVSEDSLLRYFAFIDAFFFILKRA